MIFCGEKSERRKIIENRQKSPIYRSVKGFELQTRFGVHLIRPPGQTFPLLNILYLKYIQIHHVKKILKENFRMQIKYNYFIIK